jgi:hypothetical protein
MVVSKTRMGNSSQVTVLRIIAPDRQTRMNHPTDPISARTDRVHAQAFQSELFA